MYDFGDLFITAVIPVEYVQDNGQHFDYSQPDLVLTITGDLNCIEFIRSEYV